ncbi:MAG TPA: acyl-CoA thioesterase domain-containing protein [Acidimicrobiales bacterium]|nr:acyl-CoA thioesterase domain-containing protein [Acidimicrobiales bacterium]
MTADAAELFAVEQVGPLRFRAPTHAFGTPAVFGGQLFGLALLAASGTFDGGRCRSITGSIVRAGVAGTPIELEVARLRDGSVQRVRRVDVRQAGRGLVATCVVSTGTSDQPIVGWSPVTDPARLGEQPAEPGPSPFRDRWKMHAFDFAHPTGARYHPAWVRARVSLPQTADAALDQALVAFVSDLGIVLAAPEPGTLRDVMPATSEHVVWFHAPVAAGEWVHVDIDEVRRTDGSALVLASLHRADGELAASVAQGVALRRRR